MKTIVSVNEISEFEIKPKNEIKKWKKIFTLLKYKKCKNIMQ